MPKDARLTKLYNDLNRVVFDGELPHSRSKDLTVCSSNRMTRIYGNCVYDHNPAKVTHKVQVSGKINLWEVNHTGEYIPCVQLVKTLLHEMVHLLMDCRDKAPVAGHGARWQSAWMTAGKKYDNNFGTDYMSEHAIKQCRYNYAKAQEHNNRVAADGTRKSTYKWELTCPVCGYVHRANRLGKILKYATSHPGVGHNGGKCKAQLRAKRNW